MYYLGVDGGGTKTIVAVVDQNCNIVSEASGSGTNYNVNGNETGKNLRKTISEAKKKYKIENACFGLAGIDSKKDLKNIGKILEKYKIKNLINCRIKILNDIEIILPSVDLKNGVAVIGGTGSNFYGFNNGKTARASGVGHLISDEGSSYSIGLNVLRAAVRSRDGRDEKTLLEKFVFQNKLKIKSLKNLIHENPQKTEISKFAPLAKKAAERGDKKSQEILASAVDEFVNGVETIHKKINLQNNFDVVFTGSLFTKNILFDQVKKKLQKKFPEIKIHLAEKPVIGAAKLSMNFLK